MSKEEDLKRRKERLERNLKWKDENPAWYAIVYILTAICLTIGITAFIIIVFMPHPQNVQAVVHCDSFSILNNTEQPLHLYLNYTPTFKNCTIKLNVTIWESEEQIVANKTGLQLGR
jgi:hypothetical protein